MRVKLQILMLSVLLIAACQDNKKLKAVSDRLKNDTIGEASKDRVRKNVQLDCYDVHLKWNTKDSTYKDTILRLRNYQVGDSSRRIVCDEKFVDVECEKLILESKYVAVYLKYLERLNKIALLAYSKGKGSSIVAHFYISGKNDLRTDEMQRFLIVDHRIVGINIIPRVYDGFIPIEEYDADEFNPPLIYRYNGYGG